MPLRCLEDYSTSTFDVKEYLKYWSEEALNNYPLTKDVLTDLHTVFQTVKVGGPRQLDFGCGPTIISVLSSSTQCSEIIMAEYAEQNRNEITKWLNRDTDAHDWRPLTKYVAGLEGNGMTADDVEKRVSSRIKDLIPCDILKDDPFFSSSIVPGSFDLITSSLCLESVCPDKTSYADAHKKLAGFLKKDGILVLDGVLKGDWYNVGKEKFYNLYLEKEDIDNALTQAGYTSATWYIHDIDPITAAAYKEDLKGWFVLYAKKK